MPSGPAQGGSSSAAPAQQTLKRHRRPRPSMRSSSPGIAWPHPARWADSKSAAHRSSRTGTSSRTRRAGRDSPGGAPGQCHPDARQAHHENKRHGHYASLQRPGRRGGAQLRPDTGQPPLRPPGKPDAPAAGRMTGQIPGHQPPCETGGAGHHHIQLTVPAHQLIPGTPANTRPEPAQPDIAEMSTSSAHISMHEAEYSLTLSRPCRRSPRSLFHRSGRKSDRRIGPSATRTGLSSAGADRPVPRLPIDSTRGDRSGQVARSRIWEIAERMARVTLILAFGF